MADKYFLGDMNLHLLKTMLRGALEERDAELLKSVVRELDKRGRRNITIKMVEKFLEDNAVKIGGDFADILVSLLMCVRVES